MADMDDDDDLRCPGCGGSWALISRNHRCSGHLLKAREIKSSGRGGESRPATDIEGVSYPETQTKRLPVKSSNRSKGETAPSGSRVGSRIETVGIASGLPVSKAKRGRPQIKGGRPWDEEGISRRTWYRRKERGDL